jgi:hypothetical protein
MRVKIIFSLMLFLSCIHSFGQKAMTWYSPESEEYGIYYPKDFKLGIAEDGIVTFTDMVGGMNITLSSYFFEDKAEAAQMIEKLSGFTGIKREDWANYKSKFDDLFEGRIQKEGVYWAWWCITNEDHGIAISIDKPSGITDNDINLLRHMIDSLEM